jgi:hypothetical protein
MIIRKKNKRRIGSDLLETQFFYELGYEELDQLYDKVIELFENKSYKQFYKPDFVRLTKLIGDECSSQAEALHDREESNVYYRKVKKVSEFGLRLSKKDEGLLLNLKFATKVLEESKKLGKLSY